MIKHLLRTFILIFSAGVATSVNAQQVKSFKAGDRVAFVGNSITDGGHYHSYIWLYYMTRMPYMRVDFINAGIGGDVAKQIDERLQEDVFDKHPTVMALTFGMNDTGYQWLTGAKADSNYNAKIATSYQSFLEIQKHLKAHPTVRKVMIGSSPYDGTSKIKPGVIFNKNAAMQRIVGFQKDAAKANGWEFMDFSKPMIAINKQQQLQDSTFSMQSFDRIHPTVDGHMVMAYLFLKAQGFTNMKVAAVNIDSKKNAVINNENCLITGLRSDKTGLSYTYKANALPYPIDTLVQSIGKQGRSQADGLKLVPFQQEFNQELLQVQNLNGGNKYELKIDGKLVGIWAGSQLQTGINLAEVHVTPQYQQALAVMHLNEERWAVERRLREYWWLHYSILKPHGLLHNDGEATIDSVQHYAKKDFFVGAVLNTYYKARLKPIRDAWQKEMDLLTNQIYLINRPVAHKVEILKVNTDQHVLTQK
ncbi:lysophospholipase L1-like esterase [Mucilaginibacter sp. UYP25]|uniref:SGNH/GDSL hydrolase family protein n=1 Tax=unclassified Mucilaginibacter TaxID=2617802 RepID=UPI00339A3BD1